MILRPGVQALLADARSGKFDVVIAEALDRMSRDQTDVSMLFKHLKFAGVMIVTLAEGEINELHVGLKGTMNALFLKDPRGKDPTADCGAGSRRAVPVAGCATATMSSQPSMPPASRCGASAASTRLRPVSCAGSSGSLPPASARARLSGVSTLTVSLALRASSGRIPPIRGQVKRGTGLINNELYIGRLVRQRL